MNDQELVLLIIAATVALLIVMPVSLMGGEGGGSSIITNTTNNITNNISAASLPFNQTTADTIITASASYVPLLSIPVVGGTPITIECYLNAKSNLTTSGIQIQLNLSSMTGLNQTSSIEYMTTVTAKAICVSDGVTTANTCAATTSVATIVPTRIQWYSNQTNNGTFILGFKPETNLQRAFIAQGAWCRQVN